MLNNDDSPLLTNPTTLTTDAINASILQGRRDLAAFREILETRLDGMDKAAQVALSRQIKELDSALASADKALDLSVTSHQREHALENDAAGRTISALANRITDQQNAVAVALSAQVKAVETALATVEKSSQISATSHNQEHVLEQAAMVEALNAVRSQLEEQKQTVTVAFTAQQQALQTAFKAEEGTSAIHAEAHAREHSAHERTHHVEKDQLDKASIAMDKRLEDMNAIRQQLREQTNTFVPRELLDATIGSLTARVVENERVKQEQTQQLATLPLTFISRDALETSLKAVSERSSAAIASYEIWKRGVEQYMAENRGQEAGNVASQQKLRQTTVFAITIATFVLAIIIAYANHKVGG